MKIKYTKKSKHSERPKTNGRLSQLNKAHSRLRGALPTGQFVAQMEWRESA